jgi:hypothetical protein
MKAAYLLFPLCLSLFTLAAQEGGSTSRLGEQIDDWKLVNERNGIRVFFREGHNNDIREHKAIAVIRSTPEEVEALLRNQQIWLLWAKVMRNPQTLKVVSENEYLTYEEVNMPPPTKDRDLITRYVYEKLPNGFICRVTNEPEFIPAKENMIRTPVYTALWVVKRLDDTHVELTRVCYLEPGGKVPERFVNKNMKQSAYDWLFGMRQYLERETAGAEK